MMQRAPAPPSFDDEEREEPFFSQMSLHPMPIKPKLPTESHKKVIYFVRHAEALHNVKERKLFER